MKCGILVFGAAGFIGRALVDRLLHDDYEVTAVDRVWDEKISGVQCVSGDVFNPQFLRTVIDGHDTAYHLVSTTIPSTSNRDYLYDCESNIAGTLRMLEVLVECDVKKVIFISSGGTVYGIPKHIPISESAETYPICAYGISKLAIEKYLYLYSYLHRIKAIVLRLSNPIGPGQLPDRGQGVVATFVNRILQDKEVEVWGDGTAVRDFISIDDVVEALTRVMEIERPFTLLNIGSGKGYSVNQILGILRDKMGSTIRVNYLPSRTCDVPAVVMDISKAKVIMGWEPQVTFEREISKVIDGSRKIL